MNTVTINCFAQLETNYGFAYAWGELMLKSSFTYMLYSDAIRFIIYFKQNNSYQLLWTIKTADKTLLSALSKDHVTISWKSLFPVISCTWNVSRKSTVYQDRKILHKLDEYNKTVSIKSTTIQKILWGFATDKTEFEPFVRNKASVNFQIHLNNLPVHFLQSLYCKLKT